MERINWLGSSVGADSFAATARLCMCVSGSARQAKAVGCVEAVLWSPVREPSRSHRRGSQTEPDVAELHGDAGRGGWVLGKVVKGGDGGAD